MWVLIKKLAKVWLNQVWSLVKRLLGMWLRMRLAELMRLGLGLLVLAMFLFILYLLGR